MWPFTKNKIRANSGIQANTVKIEGGEATIDVRGQTCPGYLLAINKVVDKLDSGMNIKLLITYPPGNEDIKTWCKERHIEYVGLEEEGGMWVIRVKN